MRVLLTGGTGFIGSHVAHALVANGHEVHALVRPHGDRRRIADIQDSLCFIESDLLDSSFRLPAKRFDVCLHLAWYVQPGSYASSLANMDMLRASLRLADMLAADGCQRLIAVGSLFEYDPQLTGPVREESRTKPHHLYAASKLALCEALTQFCRQTKMSLTWARLFYQYGPFENPQRLIPAIINSLLRDHVAKLTPGEQVCDYLHVADTASALSALLSSEITGVVNVASGTGCSVKGIAQHIAQIIGKPELVALNALPYPPETPMQLVADISRLRDGTNWSPQFTLDTGLRDTIEWWRSQL